MLEQVRKALRVKTGEFDDEIQSIIDACLIDLGIAGAEEISDDNALVRQAVILYAKCHFGFSDDAERYAERYQALKITMANASEYQKE
ncbi:MAG: head-tail connector protein [Coriobacteriaceae bacterium]|nr:head-tail connector protein [Coriobacteriaceae bacterium]